MKNLNSDEMAGTLDGEPLRSGTNPELSNEGKKSSEGGMKGNEKEK